MKKNILLVSFLFLINLIIIFPTQLIASHHVVSSNPVPTASGTVLEYAVDLRMLLKYRNFTPLVELEMRLEDVPTQFRYRSLTAGSYYRLSKHIKVGAFYRLQMGALHDDDWIFINPGWNWDDTRGRFEHLFILDFSPRFQLNFLPGRNWVFMFKTRYLFNTFNYQHTLKLRPGITYFLLRNREPLLNFSFNYELYVPLNWGSTFIYSHWPYLEALYHISPAVKVYLDIAYKKVTWSTSKDVIDQNELPYEVNYRAFIIGAGINIHFDL